MTTPLAGPRRARPAPPPLPAAHEAKVVVPQPVAAVAPQAPAVAAVELGPGSTRRPGGRETARAPVLPARELPPLDYDQTARTSLPRSLQPTQPCRRPRTHRARWFVLGIAFGALGAVFAHGDAHGTLHAARTWSASALRSLEHRPAAPALATTTVVASASAASAVVTAAASHAPAPSLGAPCPMNPGADDPCAALLAPFAGEPAAATRSVPLVSVNDLPRAQPTPAPTTARRHRGAAPSRPAAPPSEDEPESASPFADDPQSTPTRVPEAPPQAPPVDRSPPADPTSPAEVKTAKNEPT